MVYRLLIKRVFILVVFLYIIYASLWFHGMYVLFCLISFLDNFSFTQGVFGSCNTLCFFKLLCMLCSLYCFSIVLQFRLLNYFYIRYQLYEETQQKVCNRIKHTPSLFLSLSSLPLTHTICLDVNTLFEGLQIYEK